MFTRFLLAPICCVAPALAQVPSVYPTVQENALTGPMCKPITEIRYDEFESGKPEGYTIEVKPEGVVIISYETEAGKFYAEQTLSQLLGKTGAHQAVLLQAEGWSGVPLDLIEIKGKTLPTGKIVDYPNLPLRGTVEGFYGQPWSHEARLSQLRFYGRNKMNCYIYGPKDDRYHSAEWRKPYPEEEAARIAELAKVAKENHVNFYWAIHPGHNIKWEQEDMMRVIEKFELMYALGVRSFAVFFDDIGGEGTKPEMQAKLMNMIQKDFVDAKGDIGPLIVCPTQYNKAWSGGDYLPLLGRELDERIHIMWTGNTVVHDITLEGQNWINERIKRPALIWWNSPVTDFVRNHLCLGRVYGLGQEDEMLTAMSGFTSNPMDKPEASKIALFGVADYSWNIQGFKSWQSWEDGIKRLYGNNATFMQIFAEHNSDLGPNYHQFRREESVRVAPFFELAEADLKDKIAWDVVMAEYDVLSGSASELLRTKDAETKLTTDEIRPWLYAARYLGDAGRELVKCKFTKADTQEALDFYTDATYSLAMMELINLNENQNPYQPGIRTGSLLLTPFAQKLAKEQGEALMQAHFGGVEKLTLPSKEAFGKSSLAGFENLKVVIEKADMSLNPIAEVHALPAGGSLELNLPAAPEMSRINVKLDNANLVDWAKVEVVNAKGETLECKLDKKHDDGRLEFVFEGGKQPIVSAKLTNSSAEAQEIRLSRFSVDARQLPAIYDPAHLTDGNLSTTFMVGDAGEVRLAVPEGTKSLRVIGKHEPPTMGAVITLANGEVAHDSMDETPQQFSVEFAAGQKEALIRGKGVINEIIFE